MIPKIAPSILAADFTNIKKAVEDIEASGAEWIHLDVMDGSFVPPITFGSQMVHAIRKITKLPLDVHLMINDPDKHVDAFAEAGSDYITVHAEATVHLHRELQRIRSLGIKSGLSIVPSTPVESIIEVLPEVDLVLVMSVNPGYGGQKLIPACVEKVRKLASLREEHGYTYEISIDGGVNRATVSEIRKAGADVLVAGSAFFNAADKTEEVNALKGV